MNEWIYLILRKENTDLVNYLRSLPGLELFTLTDDGCYRLRINTDDETDFLEMVRNAETEFFTDISAFFDVLELDGDLLNDALSILKEKKSGTFFLSDLLKDAVLSNDIKIKADYKSFVISRLSKELIDTGMTFIVSGNSLEASKELFVHRNTLNYRIETIKKQTSFDLKRFIDAFVFYGILA